MINLLLFIFLHLLPHSIHSSTNTNIILILADDLGYGDLGFSPFNSNEMKNIRTPNLNRMAQSGMILKNFHSASPICSPSRAAILTGLFPWRFGIDFIYAGDLKLDGSEELDHEQLPLVSNLAITLKQGGYYTAHVGKWHLGGQSHLDIPNRVTNNCSTPGINQYGFDEYIGMSEGTNSMRYKTHQDGNTYRIGSNYLFRNDIPLPRPNRSEILTDRQTNEAMRIIREQTIANQPFFMNLWFDAPHSPWEPIEPYYTQYRDKFATNRLSMYASMISNMDYNVGRLLDLLKTLQIDTNTIVLFTSDNGPETEAGSAGSFKGRKRLLTEGGIVVPMIVQWTGRIPPNAVSNKFLINTDLYPTLIECASLNLPSNIRIDGASFLPLLVGDPTLLSRQRHLISQSKEDRSLVSSQEGDERLLMWYEHPVGMPKYSAARSHGFKLLWNDYEGRGGARLPPSFRLFDMRLDPLEDNNLIPNLMEYCDDYLSDTYDSPTWLEFSRLWHPNASLSSSNQTNASRIANMQSNYYRKALHILNYLHVSVHLFRYEGEVAWLHYHANKPYEILPDCKGFINETAFAPIPSLNQLLLPEFCGSDVYLASGGQLSSSCRCVFENCQEHWLGSRDGPHSWSSNHRIWKGLSGYAPLQTSLRSQLETLLFKSTGFNPMCPRDALIDAIESKKTVKFQNKFYKIIPPSRSLKGVQSSWITYSPLQSNQKTTLITTTMTTTALPFERYACIDVHGKSNETKRNWLESVVQTMTGLRLKVNTEEPEILNDGWVHGDRVNLNPWITESSRQPTQKRRSKTRYGFNDRSIWIRHCHQRLNMAMKLNPGNNHFESQYSVQSGSCGWDAIEVVLNLKGMALPLLLCSESHLPYNPIQSRKKKSMVLKSEPNDGGWDDGIMLIGLHWSVYQPINVGSIKQPPVTFAMPLLTSRPIPGIVIVDPLVAHIMMEDLQYSTDMNHLHRLWSGFLQPYHRQIESHSVNCFIIPIFIAGFWSVIIVKIQWPHVQQITYYNPTPISNPSRVTLLHDNIPNIFTSLLHHIHTPLADHNASLILLINTNNPSFSNDSKAKNWVNSWRIDSGLDVLTFVHRFVHHGQMINGTRDELLKSVRSSEWSRWQFEVWDGLDSFIEKERERQRDLRDQYLKLMSKNKFKKHL